MPRGVAAAMCFVPRPTASCCFCSSCAHRLVLCTPARAWLWASTWCPTVCPAGPHEGQSWLRQGVKVPACSRPGWCPPTIPCFCLMVVCSLRRAPAPPLGPARGAVPAVRLPLDEQPAHAGAAPALHRAALGHLPGEALPAPPQEVPSW